MAGLSGRYGTTKDRFKNVEISPNRTTNKRQEANSEKKRANEKKTPEEASNSKTALGQAMYTKGRRVRLCTRVLNVQKDAGLERNPTRAKLK